MEHSLLFVGGWGGFEILLAGLIFVIPTLLLIWAIIDLLRSDFSDNTIKLIWAIVIIFIPFLGALLYLIIGRKQKSKG